MSLFNNVLAGASGQGGYRISRSLRFRTSATAYLNRTPTATSNQQVLTISCWVKRGKLGASQNLFQAFTSASTYSYLYFTSGDVLNFANVISSVGKGDISTNAVFRDTAAWYHVVLALNYATPSATIYVNGVVQSITVNTALVASNLSWNTSGVGNYICSNATPSNTFDGYLTEINFIDGQALTPSSFGQINSQNGVWQPIRYAGTYGTNGFYLNFSDNSNNTATTIGKDYSGNGNNWTPNNISVTAGSTYDSMLDVPTLYADGGNGRGNYAVFNAVAKASSQPTFSNGNLDLSASSAWNGAVGTIGVTSGKWYWEVVNGNGDVFVGICGDNLVLTTADPQTLTGSILYYGLNGNKRIDGTLTSYGATYTTETIGVALDVDGGTVTFYKNNTSQGSISLSSSTLNGKTIFPFFVKYASTSTVNFGQRPFTYTPPTGFVALNTQNLPTPTISNGATVMAATTYDGNGSSQSLTNTVNSVSFQPDFVWVKKRSGATNHYLWDSVRGVLKEIYSNLTNAESTNTIGLSAFNSNGFTLNNGDSAWNASGSTYVGWQWKASGTSSSNTSGSITSTVSVNATAGFSVVTFTCTGANATVGHGLGVAPKMIITKFRGSTNSWWTYHASLATPATQQLALNTGAAANTDVTFWNSTNPTSSVFSIGTAFTPATTMVAYCWAEVAGYSKFGSYTGNGSADGPFVYLGFRPRWVMIKNTTSGAGYDWEIYDTSRGAYNLDNQVLYPDLSNAEATPAAAGLDILSNGFKVRFANGNNNPNGATMIYAAFAENPFKISLAR